jgi:hypothetical protein
LRQTGYFENKGEWQVMCEITFWFGKVDCERLCQYQSKYLSLRPREMRKVIKAVARLRPFFFSPTWEGMLWRQNHVDTKASRSPFQLAKPSFFILFYFAVTVSEPKLPGGLMGFVATVRFSHGSEREPTL